MARVLRQARWVAAVTSTPLETIVAVARSPLRPTGWVRYELTLTCGCHWWEYRGEHDAPPIAGDPGECAATHQTKRLA